MWFRLTLALVAMGMIGTGASVHAAANVVVVLDDSGSMGDPLPGADNVRKMDAAKLALLTVVSILPAETQLGVLALNGHADDPWIVALGPLKREALARAIGELDAEGGTPLGAAMKTAADALLRLRAKQIYGTYRLLIVTDGEAQDADLVDAYLPAIRNRGLEVDVIGVAMAQDHSLATRVDQYRRADDPQSLHAALRESLAEAVDDTAQDTGGQADFELLAGLPDDVASALVAELSRQDNQLIGESTADQEELAEHVTWPHGVEAVPVPHATPPPSFGSPMVAIVVIFVFIMGILKSIIGAGRRRR